MFTASFETLAFLPFGGSIGSAEMVIIGVVAVLLFGKRLPEVGRSLGKSLVEFKKGMAGIENEIRSATSFDINAPVTPRRTTPSFRDDESLSDSAVPRFEPPPTELAANDAPKFEPPQYEPPTGEPQLN